MGITLPAFTPLEDSLWLTLCCRALDYRTPHPVLGDAMADQIVRTVDYDYKRLNIGTNLRLNATIRAKKMDEVASAYLTRHPDAIGLDLGAGLDTRRQRLAPPDTVDWYDVDFPVVATARSELIPERPHAHVIGADVTDKGWLDGVPSDRQAIIVADGLMGFLSQEELMGLWDQLLDHFPTGEMVFNSYTNHIPLTFLLGFYVGMVVKRWWEQFHHLSYPDGLLYYTNLNSGDLRRTAYVG